MDPKLLFTVLVLFVFEEACSYILLVPGTKWCGKGNLVSGYNDLGKYKETDKCCRAHDNCKEYIMAGDSKYGLLNDGIYTRLHCNCDSQFYSCLKNCHEYISEGVGKGYFNYLPEKCFDFRYPATCTKFESDWTSTRCSEYSYNETLPMQWQWFEMQLFD